MKHLLLTTIAAVLMVGCGESQQSAPPVVKQQSKPLSEADQLLEAAASGNVETVKTLLAAGVDVNGEEGWTPLHATVLNMKFYASNKGHKKIIELLLEKGADVNSKMENGMTALHLSAWDHEKEIAELLIVNGADINAMNMGSQTPLDRAIQRIQGFYLLPPLDKDKLDSDIQSLLRKHGGKTGEELKAEGK